MKGGYVCVYVCMNVMHRLICIIVSFSIPTPSVGIIVACVCVWL